MTERFNGRLADVIRRPLITEKATRAIEDLRAIPWGFSWGQCRVALPGWYGFGSAIEALLSQAKDREAAVTQLQQMHRQWPFFRTLLSNMDMVLAKSDLALASRYRIPGAYLVVGIDKLTSIEQARTAFQSTDLRQRLARYHDDVDCAFWQWNDVWLSGTFSGWAKLR